jgi:hypothetical protein
LHKQERRILERTKAEIKSSLRIDVGVVSSQQAPATSPLPNPNDEQVLTPPDTPFSDSRNSRDHELPPLPQDTSSTHSVSSAAPSSLVRNHSQLGERKVLAASVISVDPGNHIDARKDSELASPINDLFSESLNTSSRSFDARSHSPSLVSLGRRSVVRKRLVEMQNGSTSRGSSSRDPRLSPRHKVAALLTRGRPVGMFEAFLELSATGSHIDVIRLSLFHRETDKPRLVSSSFLSDRSRQSLDLAYLSSLRFFDALG